MGRRVSLIATMGGGAATGGAGAREGGGEAQLPSRSGQP